jgi:hypothetical protein
MSTPDIRAALERLIELEDDKGPAPAIANAWTDAITRARAALAEPVGEGPTDEKLIQLAIDTRLYRFQATAGDPVQYEMTEQQVHAFARAVLARWGRSTPQPIPVSERLPGEGDCDAEGRCWLLHVDKLGLLEWHFLNRYPSLDSYSYYGYTHWLPHHAIPLPQVGEGEA